MTWVTYDWSYNESLTLQQKSWVAPRSTTSDQCLNQLYHAELHWLNVAQTTAISGTIWLQLWNKFWLGIVRPQFGRNGWSWALEMGPLSSPVVITYRLPIVTIRPSLTFFPLLRLVTDRKRDRRNWSTKRWHYVIKCSGCQKWERKWVLQ